MVETNERDREAMERWVRMCVDDDGMAPELLAAIRDAARLQRIERQVRELADEYGKRSDGKIRMCASRFRAIVDTGDEEGE